MSQAYTKDPIEPQTVPPIGSAIPEPPSKEDPRVFWPAKPVSVEVKGYNNLEGASRTGTIVFVSSTHIRLQFIARNKRAINPIYQEDYDIEFGERTLDDGQFGLFIEEKTLSLLRSLYDKVMVQRGQPVLPPISAVDADVSTSDTDISSTSNEEKGTQP